MPIKKRNKKLQTHPRRDLTGKKINDLLVLKFLEYRERPNLCKGKIVRDAIWECKCVCGKIIQVPQCRITVKKHSLQSCGCSLEKYREQLRNNCISINTKPKGVASFNLLYYSYKKRAQTKKLPFSLSRKQFLELTKKTCFYCGIPPLQSVLTTRQRRANGDYLYNGIDRIDSKKGYTLSNCVTCCSICNKAKRDIPFDEFILWVNRLSSYSQKINYIEQLNSAMKNPINRQIIQKGNKA